MKNALKEFKDDDRDIGIVEGAGAYQSFDPSYIVCRGAGATVVVPAELVDGLRILCEGGGARILVYRTFAEYKAIVDLMDKERIDRAG
jgi:hypothetical protein